MYNLKNKLNLLNGVTNLILLFCTFLTYNIGTLFYNSAQSPDFGKYIKYIEYYLGDRASTQLEQGNLYYYLVSKVIDIKSNSINPRSFEEYISYSIQTTNFIIFLIFLFGFYLFFKLKGFKDNEIKIIMILLNFFPPLLTLRLIYKPEILILCLFMWVLYFFEKYLVTSNKFELINISLFLSLIISTKITSAIMVLIFLSLNYSSHFWKKERKLFILMTSITGLLFAVLAYENYTINQQVFFSVPPEVLYQEKADLRFIYNINFKELIFSPYKDFHSDSMMGIILLETFDDYFQLYWNTDSSLFHRNQEKPHIFINAYLSILLTFFFYISSFYISRVYKKEKILILSPLIGISTMCFISLFLIFESSSGDMMKNYYYSFFLILSFSYVMFYCIRETKVLKYIVILIFCSSVFTILGFPKQYDTEILDRISEQNKVSLICSLNAGIINLESDSCAPNQVQICEDVFSKYRKTQIVDRKITLTLLDKYNQYEFTNIESSRFINNLEDCLEVVNNDWKIKDFYQNTKKPPFANLIFFLFPYIFIIVNKYFFKNKLFR